MSENPDPFGVEAARKFYAERGEPYDPDTIPEDETDD